MSRNANSRLQLAPTINVSRSRFNRDHQLTTSFNVGELVPIYWDQDVLPGQTSEIRTSAAIRLTPMVAPVYDNLFMDTFYFFVPMRLIWSHAKEFFGENTQSAWYPTTEYTIPQITAPASTGWDVGTLADYFGLPTGVPGISVSALLGRAYALVVNEWFRSTQLQDPLAIDTGDSTVAGVNSGNYITDCAKLGKPFIAGKVMDYFVSAAPGPQYGDPVTIPLTSEGNIPVRAIAGEVASVAGDDALRWSYASNNGAVTGFGPSGSVIGLAASGSATRESAGSISATGTETIMPRNLFAVNDGDLVGTTITSLRLAFAVQKFLERQAISGSRYTEIIRSMFSVVSPDARLQRPEYLGGRRVNLSINSVIQASQTTDTSPQGNVAGLSFTTDTHHDFVRSFTEHGVVIGLACVRYQHRYQQGIERGWLRKDKFDFYWPLLSNIGNQEIKNAELYAQGTSKDDEVFGYTERFAEYRMKRSTVTGQMRSAANGSLDAWHFADDYSELPHLSSEWLMEDKANVDRALAIQSSNSNQILADFWFTDRATLPMPVYSIPGLIDHH